MLRMNEIRLVNSTLAKREILKYLMGFEFRLFGITKEIKRQPDHGNDLGMTHVEIGIPQLLMNQVGGYENIFYQFV